MTPVEKATQGRTTCSSTRRSRAKGEHHQNCTWPRISWIDLTYHCKFWLYKCNWALFRAAIFHCNFWLFSQRRANVTTLFWSNVLKTAISHAVEWSVRFLQNYLLTCSLYVFNLTRLFNCKRAVKNWTKFCLPVYIQLIFISYKNVLKFCKHWHSWASRFADFFCVSFPISSILRNLNAEYFARHLLLDCLAINGKSGCTFFLRPW